MALNAIKKSSEKRLIATSEADLSLKYDWKQSQYLRVEFTARIAGYNCPPYTVSVL